MTKRISVLGATGIIGGKTLEVIASAPEEFSLYGITAHANATRAIEYAHRYGPKVVCFTGLAYDKQIVTSMPSGVRCAFGEDSYKEIINSADCDMALLAFVGIAGLPALMDCISNGLQIALANKEALVCGGSIVRAALAKSGASIVPVDSELSAIFQSLGSSYDITEVRRAILTASGGPFRTWDAERIYNAGAAEALRHPNWTMGQKITIDCATLANKGLEIMETRWLFDLPSDMIDVVVHPQSIVHSMVEFKNGAVMAHLAPPDMSHAIQYAMSYPTRLDSAVGFLDFPSLPALTFEQPDAARFPCFRIARECLADSLAACVVFNSANEAAVDLLLRGKIVIGNISELIQAALDSIVLTNCETIENVYELSAQARRFVYNRF